MADQIQPDDDYFHRRPPDDPFWNESAYFPFHNIERSLSGFFYMNHRPNMNFSLAGLIVWDPSGEHSYDALYHDWGQYCPLNESTNTEMFDYKTPNGVTLRCAEPLKSFTLQYDGDGVTADLNWEATMEPFNAPFPSGSEEWGAHHYEQAGRVSGTIRVNGEDIAIDCGSNRDRSWGSRRYALNPRGDWPWFNDGNGTALHMYVVSDKAIDEDPIHDTTERPLWGWFQHEGKVAGIVSGARHVVERRADGVPLRLTIEGTDELGRNVRAEGRTKNVFWWEEARLLQFFQLCEWELDTGQKVHGEAIEWFPRVQARRFLRSL
jgi:hypothetical protein